MASKQSLLVGQDRLIDKIAKVSKSLSKREYSYLRKIVRNEIKALSKLSDEKLKKELPKSRKRIESIIDQGLISDFASMQSKYKDFKTLQEKLYESVGYENVDKVDYQGLKAVEKLSLTKLGGSKQILKSKIAEQLKYANFTKYENPNQIFRKVSNNLGAYRGHAFAIANTATIAADRAIANDIAESVGCNWFTYQGPDDKINRPFCQNLLDNINPNTKEAHSKYWHIDDIKKLKNGQIDDVFLYAGGYNCRHRWVMVSADKNRELNKKYHKAQEA